MNLSSTQNPLIKEFRKLASSASKRRESNLIFLEGPHILQEAAKKGLEFSSLLVTEKFEHGFLDDYEKIIISESVSKHLSETKSPQGVFALIKTPIPVLKEYKKILVLDEIQDPGNMGTIIRSAAAFGFEAIVTVNQGGVDPWSPKVIRSAQGGHFCIDIVERVAPEDLKLMFPHPLYSAEPIGNISLKSLDPAIPKGYILGNEGQGVSEEICKALATDTVKIEMKTDFESLNVAIAAGIILFHEMG